jgi:hypothetical protein
MCIVMARAWKINPYLKLRHGETNAHLLEVVIS